MPSSGVAAGCSAGVATRLALSWGFWVSAGMTAGRAGMTAGAGMTVAERRRVEPRLEGLLVAPARDHEPGRPAVGGLEEFEALEAFLVVDGASASGEPPGKFVAAVGRNGDRVDLDDRHGLNAAMDEWSVRPATDEDSAALIELIGTVWSEYPGCVLDVDGEEPWMRAPATFYAERDGQFWVAVDDDTGDLIACVGIKPVATDTVELKSLYVAARGRRTGLGSALVRLVEDTATDRQARRIVLWSDTRFADAHRLYTRLGYEPTGESRELHDLSNTTEYGFTKDL